ncbi:hypothetical protein [Haloprofundus marisrubri]|uniref:hypothetical protein n=1 Tax=Haloprofundus marisrubri TaxID=1514971 RepID=UPI0014701B99|nr:hypothetical protein [Haloprofundus marisrubri]
MFESLSRISLFALYHLTLALGIALLPLTLAVRQFGVQLPVGRLVETVGTAYENAAAQ